LGTYFSGEALLRQSEQAELGKISLSCQSGAWKPEEKPIETAGAGIDNFLDPLLTTLGIFF
jgi:hypothetical protein